ncbi:FHA domain-containing protein FhaA [Polystyrenella longa]|uniref:FHA domain-containing protein FhaA n=1 Tax=Polystyrenella longa TaxID=2528007 RepID=A0A518CPX1_9PLAN|nr:FHA domain-containing protein [Polystyrenella longa]QDU81276.1 FHA domain-containing protein FhaA [Polystyrenella longa]
MYKLIVKNGPDEGRQYKLEAGQLYDVGRGSNTTIRVRDSYISRVHARINVEEDEAMIHDWGSSSGLFVNDEQIDEAELKDGDVIRMGNTEITVAC